MTDTADSFRFSHLIRVVEADIDELHHANNVQYVRWVQDIASAHWRACYPPSAAPTPTIWVVLEHRIRYLRPALLDDELRCTTWVAEVRGAQSQRFTRIERTADGALLCEAETQWAFLDPQTLRPRRVPEEVIRRLREAV
ncbi:acyl-CoA thioester hydrolase [Hymenobacter daecheongensis DSM 21074]|uniref:Acyl-CoA thioester hydrolase n=1 Tax=Hymenobacter daecheongensis DSM 21074 TaxID=1121955 RepID=A0A1M6HUE8_9BACT|nr:thioesterase family protein [Hymenobacter daecheongensis]SHJ25815.1 acyl-CoA thioester hydrolase [Hymenobacter daecheongensis DSM 21074]